MTRTHIWYVLCSMNSLYPAKASNKINYILLFQKYFKILTYMYYIYVIVAFDFVKPSQFFVITFNGREFAIYTSKD